MRFSGHKPQGRYNDAMPVTTPNYLALASYQNCMQRLQGAWKAFATIRQDRLRHGEVAEKVAEGIVEDLLTGVLDWTKGDITYQIDYADIVLSRNLQKYLVIEVKKPGTLRLGRQSLAVALAQALRYAHAQHIGQVAVSDGYVFYAADVLPGGLQHRVVVNLADPQPPAALWWVSVHGVYRPMEDSRPAESLFAEEPYPATIQNQPDQGPSVLLHRTYRLPACCFAWVGDANKPSTWKLPYLKENGTIDDKRLPKAIQSLLTNYRGAKVRIPESGVGEVLLRLAQAAKRANLLPPESVHPAPVYQQLILWLEQNGRSSEI